MSSAPPSTLGLYQAGEPVHHSEPAKLLTKASGMVEDEVGEGPRALFMAIISRDGSRSALQALKQARQPFYVRVRGNIGLRGQ